MEVEVVCGGWGSQSRPSLSSSYVWYSPHPSHFRGLRWRPAIVAIVAISVQVQSSESSLSVSAPLHG